MIVWFTAFVLFALLAVASRDGVVVVAGAAFSAGRAFFDASFARFASFQPREASMLSHECPSTSTPPIASAASEGGDRSTATLGVISAVTLSQYPGSLRPTRAETSRRGVPARRDACETKTSPRASAGTFRREAREGRGATRARAAAEASGVAIPAIVTACRAGRRAPDHGRWRASVC
jgi:hypothetical protein